MQNIIFWFRNDLRLHDNEAFLLALQAGNVIPVYVFDERYFANNFLGFKRTGAFRTKFLIEAVEDLRKNLREKGSELIVRVGQAEDIIAQIAEDSEALAVFASKEVTQDETTIEASLSKILKPLNIELELIWSATLYHARDLPFQIHFLPVAFNDFRKKIEQSATVRRTFDLPGQLSAEINIEPGKIPTFQDLGFDEAPTIDERTSFNFTGGETFALARLEEYFWHKNLLKTHKENRSALTGADYSSKLAPWLSLGCLSPRKVYEEVKKYEAQIVNNESTNWMIIELLWRDYFHFSALKHGTRMFKASGIKNELLKQWKRQRPDFDAWVNSKTGVPFIDANMCEVRLTGYMSDYGRQAVAAYLTKDLGIDWTWGATYFESILIDYDVCSNWGNWNYIADSDAIMSDNLQIDDPALQGSVKNKEEYIQLWRG